MEIGNAYIPMDWRHVFANNSSLEENQTGAALFADISGFTPLTEAFALELGPKRGGEELTVHLNRVYDGLIGVLHRYGGSVVSFSGDAITCWLDGDLDGRHAVRCAIEMQAVMNTVAQIVTPAGQEIILGLKVAVAVGSVKRFIVGLPEYTLMDAMAGKTVESVASAEQVAERGDVVIDRATFDVLEPHLTIKEWRVDEDSEDSFAVVESFALEPKESPWETLDDSTFTQTMIEHWLLPAVGTRISGGMGEFLTELRPAAALFIRFTGIDYDNDPEAPLKLNSFVQMVQRIMMRFEGSLLQLTIGDKGSYLYAAFGSPIAHEDDIDRAALASLALQHETKQLDYIEPIQIGISHGRMRTGAYGAVQRRTYGVLGDHVNLSARLMSKAPSGQIYMSHAAYRKIKDKFIWEPLQPMTVKGKSYTINAYRLLRRRQRQSFKLHEPVYRLPMVGRQAELNKIAQKIDRVLEGNGQIIGITADAGMGKSRLATEVIRTAFEVGLDGFAGECQSFGTNTSYLVWQAIWRAWFDLTGDEPAEDQIDLVRSYLKEADPAYLSRLPLLAPVLNLPIPDNELTATLDAKTKKSSLESLLVELVRYRAQGQPFLIVLEDCHWLDDLSKELIYEIGKFIENLPVMMLMVYRLPDTQREQLPKVHELPFFTEVSLNHFTSEEAARLIDLKIDEFFGKNQVPTPFVDLIIQKAAGNPFYLDEIINLVQDRGVDPTDEEALFGLDLPDTIYSLVLSRIDSLTETQKIAIRVASVIGRLFPAVMVWGIYPTNEVTTMVMQDLEHLSEIELTPIEQPEPELTYIFKHIVTQEVAYESLPFSTRSRLHGQIGTFIEFKYSEDIDKNLDLLAFHFNLSRNEAKKRHYLQRAGDAAKANYANHAAISYYTDLIPLLSDQEKVSVLDDLGAVKELIGAWDEAGELYRESISLAESLDLKAELSKVQAALGELRRKRGDFPESQQWLESSLEISQSIDDLVGIGQVYITMGTLNAQQGDLDKALDLYSQSLEIRRLLNDDHNIGKVLNNMAVVAEYQGNIDECRAYLEESLIHRRRSGERLEIGRVLGNLGYVELEQGNFDKASEMLQEALVIFREIGDKWSIANTLNNLGRVHTTIGEFRNASTVYLESLSINSDLGDKWALAFLLEDIAGMLAQRSRSPVAIHLAGAADSLRKEIESPLSDSMRERLTVALQPSEEALGEGAPEAWAYGRGLGLDSAVDFASNALA